MSIMWHSTSPVTSLRLLKVQCECVKLNMWMYWKWHIIIQVNQVSHQVNIMCKQVLKLANPSCNHVWVHAALQKLFFTMWYLLWQLSLLCTCWIGYTLKRICRFQHFCDWTFGTTQVTLFYYTEWFNYAFYIYNYRLEDAGLIVNCRFERNNLWSLRVESVRLGLY